MLMGYTINFQHRTLPLQYCFAGQYTQVDILQYLLPKLYIVGFFILESDFYLPSSVSLIFMYLY